MQPQDIEKIKSLVQTSPILSQTERGEWLALLDLMNDKQLLELQKILNTPVKVQKAPAPLPVQQPVSSPAPVVKPQMPKLSHIVNLPNLSHLQPENKITAAAQTKPQPITPAQMKPEPSAFASKLKAMVNEKELPAPEPEAALTATVKIQEKKPLPSPASKPIPAPQPIIKPKAPTPTQPKEISPQSVSVSAPAPAPALKPSPPPVPKPKPAPVVVAAAVEPQVQPQVPAQPQPKVVSSPQSSSSSATPAAEVVDKAEQTKVNELLAQALNLRPKGERAPVVTPVVKINAPPPTSVAATLESIPGLKAAVAKPLAAGGLAFREQSEKERNQTLQEIKQHIEQGGDDTSQEKIKAKLDQLSDLAVLGGDNNNNLDFGFMTEKIKALVGQFGYHEALFNLEKSPLYQEYITTGTQILSASGDFEHLQGGNYLTRQQFEQFADVLREIQAS